jgi:hypothetical protein
MLIIAEEQRSLFGPTQSLWSLLDSTSSLTWYDFKSDSGFLSLLFGRLTLTCSSHLRESQEKVKCTQEQGKLLMFTRRSSNAPTQSTLSLFVVQLDLLKNVLQNYDVEFWANPADYCLNLAWSRMPIESNNHFALSRPYVSETCPECGVENWAVLLASSKRRLSKRISDLRHVND